MNDSLVSGRRAESRAATVMLVLLASTSSWGQTPLDLLDETPRDILVRFEDSSDLSVVGQSFGPAYPATYSVSGNIGTLVISAATHEAIRGGFLSPVPASFTPMIFQFDRTTFEATSQPASGLLSSGPISLSFTQNALSTVAPGGFMGPDIPPFFCSSQQEVDDLCTIIPIFCGQSCTIVGGDSYDPLTGRVNLVGSVTESGCDGAFCDGPFDFFAPGGDLYLSEAVSLGSSANNDLNMLGLFTLLAGTGTYVLTRPQRAGS